MDPNKEKENKPKVEDIFGEAGKRPEQPSEQPRHVEIEKPVETKTEQEPEPERTAEKIEESKEAPSQTTPTPAQTPVQSPAKSETYQQVETILEEDLKDIYLQMSEEERERFKKAGEEAAGKIETLLQETKIRVKNILSVIKNWLRLIPGMNKYFLEQEAKIKTDKIIAIKQHKD